MESAVIGFIAALLLVEVGRRAHPTVKRWVQRRRYAAIPDRIPIAFPIQAGRQMALAQRSAAAEAARPTWSLSLDAPVPANTEGLLGRESADAGDDPQIEHAAKEAEEGERAAAPSRRRAPAAGAVRASRSSGPRAEKNRPTKAAGTPAGGGPSRRGKGGKRSKGPG